MFHTLAVARDVRASIRKVNADLTIALTNAREAKTAEEYCDAQIVLHVIDVRVNALRLRVAELV